MAPGNLLDATWWARPGRAFPELPVFLFNSGNKCSPFDCLMLHCTAGGWISQALQTTELAEECMFSHPAWCQLAGWHPPGMHHYGGNPPSQHYGYGLITTKPQSSSRTSSDLSEKLNELTTAELSPKINLLPTYESIYVVMVVLIARTHNTTP